MHDIKAVELIRHLQFSYSPHVFDRITFLPISIALIFRNFRFPYKFLLHHIACSICVPLI